MTNLCVPVAVCRLRFEMLADYARLLLTGNNLLKRAYEGDEHARGGVPARDNGDGSRRERLGRPGNNSVRHAEVIYICRAGHSNK